MPPQITCASALPSKTRNTKNAFFTHCVSALPEFNQSLLDFFDLSDSWFSHAAAWLPKSCSQWVQFGLLGGIWGTWFRRKQANSAAEVCVLSSAFPLSQGNAEALDRWGRKTNISYFLSNTSAKNYRNQIVYVKITASQRWNVFFLRHSVIMLI